MPKGKLALQHIIIVSLLTDINLHFKKNGVFTVSVWEYLSRITSLVLSFVFFFFFLFFHSDTFPFPNMIVHLRFTLKHSGLCSVILSGYYGIYLQTWHPFKLKTWNFCQKISFKAYVLFPATIQTGTEVY